MKYLVLLGRIFYAAIFITAAPGHFQEGAIGYAASHGVPLPHLLVPLSGVMAFLGGLSILLGLKARWGAWLLVMFLVPVTLTMHNYWAIADPVLRGTQHVMFMKNLSMLGAALIITQLGSGPLSLTKK